MRCQSCCQGEGWDDKRGHQVLPEGSPVKSGFTPEVTPRKSGVECGWDLTSPYVVHPCLHTQWSCISGLVGGGDKGLS